MTSSTSSANATSWRDAGAPAIALPSPAPAGRARLLDLRDTTNHPLSLRYAEVFEAAVLRGRFEHGRAQPGLDVARSTPFVIAARRAVDHGIERADVLDVMVATLAAYYERVRPGHAAAWLGLDDTAHPALREAPPWAAVFPWRARSVASYRKAYEDAAFAENRAVGRDVGIEDGWLFCGPVSADKVRIEAERILYVLRRIAEHGYQRSDDSDGDVRATALVDEQGSWRWLITAGNHRASAAAALGLAEIPVRVNLVISRADVCHWKHVAEGLYTVEQALAVFDRYFDACPGAVAKDWAATAAAN